MSYKYPFFIGLLCASGMLLLIVSIVWYLNPTLLSSSLFFGIIGLMGIYLFFESMIWLRETHKMKKIEKNK